ncbi:MAG TPA: DUF2298 domain-containing protein [Chloroflexia bacterium]|nr:DUF2298 domain-containing protein [Chloroflexia bacterium]
MGRTWAAGAGLLLAAGMIGVGTAYMATAGEKSLLLSTPLSALPDLGDWSWNPLAQNQGIGLLLWLGVVEALGWLAWPLTARVCRPLPDRGYPLSKTLALVLVAWPVWLAASLHLVPFTVWSILGAIGGLAAGAALLWRRDGRELRAWMGAHRRLLLAWEGLFALVFAAGLTLRLLDPDLWQPLRGGEKPMDFGFLNAILRSAWMPPPDPFFAGGYINYYYYGQFLVACLVKLIGLPSAVGYNLALPLLYALLALGVASVVYNAVRQLQDRPAGGGPGRRRAFAWSLAGVGLVTVAGNLHMGLQAISQLAPDVYSRLLALFASWDLTAPAMTKLFTSFEYWPVSRVAPRTITEFPYWIFLFGDLHAHLIALPFQAALLGLAASFLFGAGLPRLTPDTALRLGVTALVLGALAVINTWDFVTYSGILIGVGGLLVLRARAVRPPGAPYRELWPMIGRAGAGVGLVLGLALLAYAPFFLAVQAFYNQVRPLLDGVNGMRRTHLAEWLVIWGLFAFITASYVGVGLWRGRRAGPGAPAGLVPPILARLLLAGGGVIALGCLLGAQWLLALLVLLLAGTLALHLGSVHAPGLLLAGLLLAAALAATLGVELFYVADFLQDTEWFRMNTIFKFSMQAWLLFGCGTTIALYSLSRPPPPRPLPRPGGGVLLRLIWLGLLGGLLAAAGIFVVAGTQSRLEERFPVRPPGPTLDGTAFMAGNSFPWGPITHTVTVTLGDDQAAYTWLEAHAHGLPIVATAPTAPDPEGMFVATYTGLPVVVGSLHQEEQRYPAQVLARRADMVELFQTPDAARAGALLRKYQVRYIYLGPYEQVLAYGAPGALAKFRAMTGPVLEIAYANPGVTIYRVRDPGE